MKLLYAFIIFGYVCNDSPVMEEQCHQVYFPGVLSRADCSVKFASYMSRYQDKIAKNSLSMTDVYPLIPILLTNLPNYLILSYENLSCTS